MKKTNWWIIGIAAVIAALFLFEAGMTLGGGAGVYGS